MAINVSTLESNLTTKINATSGTTEAKEFLLLGKAVESINTAVSNTSLQPSNNLSDVSDAATARTNLGVDTYVTTQINNVVDAAPGALDTLNELAAALGDDANFSTTVTNSIATKLPLAGGTLTGDLTLTSSSGNRQIAITSTSGIASLEVGGTTSAFIDVKVPNTDDFDTRYGHESLNCTGDYVFQRANSTKLTLNSTGADVTGTLTTDGVTVDGTLDIEEVVEKAAIDTSTSGLFQAELKERGVVFLTANQTANRQINFRGDGSNSLNSMLATGQSITMAVLATQGSTAYYLNTYSIDGTTVTPKWSGGSAPTAGNANSIDVYTFTIIKTADATFTVLASQTQYA